MVPLRQDDLVLLSSRMRNELLVLKNDASQFESQIQTYPIIRFHQDRTVNLVVTMPRLHE